MIKNKKVIILILILLLIIIGALIIKTNLNSQNLIKIGAIFPLTGKEASVGESMKNALDLAVSDINSSGGINGQKVSIIYEDSQSDVKRGVDAYTKLTKTDNVREVFSTIGGITLAIAPLAEKDKVLSLSVSTAATQISTAGDYTFRHNLLPQDEISFLAGYLISKNIKEVPVLATNSEAGMSYYDFFKKDYESLGGKIVLFEKYEKGSIDYRLILSKIKGLGYNNVIDFAYASEMGLTFKQAKELGMNIQWYTVFTTEDNQTINLAGSAANGVIYTHFYNPDKNNKIYYAYSSEYFDKYGIEPNSYSGLAYDFIEILFDNIRKCKTAGDTSCIKNELYKTQGYEGVTGKISFDQNGDTRKEIILKTIKDGQFVKL
jgi:branched-chain amino acid transport system substrate-binding protein